MKIVSPTTTERILRTLGLTAMFCVFSGWFLYDGFVGYQKHNLQKIVESLNPVPAQLPPMDPRVTAERFRRWEESVGGFAAKRMTRKDITDQYGHPGWESPNHEEIRYFGPGGSVRLTLIGDLVKGAVYEPAEHDDNEMMWQKFLGFMLSPVAVGMVFQLLRVLTTKVTLDEEGLKVRGRALIPFGSMNALHTESFARKGYLDLYYDQNGKRRRVRLDDYVIRELRPIVQEICRRCGWPDSLPPPKDDSEPDGLKTADEEA